MQELSPYILITLALLGLRALHPVHSPTLARRVLPHTRPNLKLVPVISSSTGTDNRQLGNLPHPRPLVARECPDSCGLSLILCVHASARSDSWRPYSGRALVQDAVDGSHNVSLALLRHSLTTIYNFIRTMNSPTVKCCIRLLLRSTCHRNDTVRRRGPGLNAIAARLNGSKQYKSPSTCPDGSHREARGRAMLAVREHPSTWQLRVVHTMANTHSPSESQSTPPEATALLRACSSPDTRHSRTPDRPPCAFRSPPRHQQHMRWKPDITQHTSNCAILSLSRTSFVYLMIPRVLPRALSVPHTPHSSGQEACAATRCPLQLRPAWIATHQPQTAEPGLPGKCPSSTALLVIVLTPTGTTTMESSTLNVDGRTYRSAAVTAGLASCNDSSWTAGPARVTGPLRRCLYCFRCQPSPRSLTTAVLPARHAAG